MGISTARKNLVALRWKKAILTVGITKTATSPSEAINCNFVGIILAVKVM
jgi:hypothetical protein